MSWHLERYAALRQARRLGEGRKIFLRMGRPRGRVVGPVSCQSVTQVCGRASG